MRNDNSLSLINLKAKLHPQRLFFINENGVGGSNFILNVVSRVVVERHVECCNHDATCAV